MLKQAFKDGFAAALARFKIATTATPVGVNPALPTQPAAGAPATMPKAPSPPNAPVAAHAEKSNILG